jgi:acetyl esterase/lipase
VTIHHRVENHPSVAARALSALVRATVRPALAIGCHGPDLSALPHTLTSAVNAVERLIPVIPPPVTQTTTVALPNCAVTLTTSNPPPPDRQLAPARQRGALLYLHGGAFFTCSSRSHTAIISRLATHSGAMVMSVDYRRHPRFCVDDALDDAMDGYRELRNRGFTPQQIVLAGDSCGGFLAFSLARLLWLGGETPAALALLSPLLRLDAEVRENRHSDAMIPPVAFKYLQRMIRKAGGQPPEPLENLPPGMPPTIIHVSADEVLRSDGFLAAKQLAATGTDVHYRVWRGQIHVFQIAAPLVPEADRSLAQIGGFAAEMIKTAQTRKRAHPHTHRSA